MKVGFPSQQMQTPVQVCRWLPWTVRNYKLDELTDVPTLRSNVAYLFRKGAHIEDPKVGIAAQSP